jgi:hypothetical protein
MSYKLKSEGGICIMPSELRFHGLFRSFLFMIVITVFLTGCEKNQDKSSPDPDPLIAAGISQVVPVNLADSIEVNPVVSVTFAPGTDPSKISESTLTLKKGSSSVPGKTSISGTTAIFTPDSDLTPETEYTATVKTGPTGSSTESQTPEYSWKFKTGKHHHNSALSVISTDPNDKAIAVPVGTSITVTFNKELTSKMKYSTSIVLKKGESAVEGTLSISGSTALFKPSGNLAPNTVYTGKVKMGSGYHNDNNYSGDNYYWSFTTGANGNDVTAPSVSFVVPANNAVSVATSTNAIVTFTEAMNPATISSTTFTLKQGTTGVAGSVSYSGVTATFTPASALAANTVYTGTVTTSAKDLAGNALAATYSWSFTTASSTDITAPTVLSTTPANNATSVATSTNATVTFSEAMNPTTISSTTFTLKQGTTGVAGSVSYSGTTATFTPSTNLASNTVYTGTITTGAKDASGNALATNHTWSFTTAIQADVTAPTVLSVTPLLNATSVAVNSKATVTFSEAMNSSTITSSTAGTVSYSGNTASFTPSSALAGNTVYTCTITTGAKDGSGNAITANYSWSFTTVATSVLLSFATDVVPVLTLCNDCHKHQWTTSSVASTFYTNLVNGGYVNPSSPNTSKISTKLSSGHPGSSMNTADINKILNWMTEGSNNN